VAKHRCKVPEPPPDTGRWLGTYGDMVTLLMAFFVMLFAVSDTNAEKFEAFISGLAGPFDNQALSLGLLAGDNAEVAVDPIEMIAPAEGFEATPATLISSLDPEAVDELEALTAAQAQLAEVEGEIEAVLSATTVPISADVRDDERGLVIAITTDEVLFQTGSAELSPDGRALITELAPVLRDAPNTVVVEGHTDDQPLARGGYTNWNLSTDRAVAVVQLLGDVLGVPYDRVSAAGYGEHRPLVPNDGPANRAKNRRVEILVVALELAPDAADAGGSAGAGAAGIPAASPGSAPPDTAVAAGGEPALDFSEALPGAGSTPIASILGR
jgi:chemotaxis protein MotB